MRLCGYVGYDYQTTTLSKLEDSEDDKIKVTHILNFILGSVSFSKIRKHCGERDTNISPIFLQCFQKASF